MSTPPRAPAVSLLFWALLAGHVLHVARAYPGGAGSQACDTESPQVCHKASPQTSPSPYGLEVKDTTYSPGTAVNVTLAIANGDKPFLGFLVGAHSVTSSKTEYLGSFASTSDSQPRCGTGGNTGVTQTSADPKKSVVLVWTPPESSQGDIVFTGAIVQDFAIYWVDVSSGVLKPRDYPAPNQTVTTTAPKPTDAQIPKDPRCGHTKSCFGDCGPDGRCTFLATWYRADQWLVISFQSVVGAGDNAWAALGFGPDPSMNPASVTECVIYNGEVQAFNSFNSGNDNVRVTPDPKVGLENVTGGLRDGVLTCRVHRRLEVADGGPQVYNLTTPFHILLARGPANAWSIQPHDSDDAFVTGARYDVTAFVDVGAQARSPRLVQLHGCLMTLAWVFSASIGVLVARFYKQVWHTQIVCGVKVWFALHRLVMVTALLATAAAFVLIFVHVGGWSEISESAPLYQKTHPILGVIVTVLTILNPIMSLFRCDPSHDFRPLFNWAHFLVGVGAYVAGVVTVGIGINMPMMESPAYLTYSVIGFGGWHVLAHLLLEITKCCERSDTMVGAYKDLQSFSQSYDAIGYHTFRQAVFAVHIIVAFGVSVAIVCGLIGV